METKTQKETRQAWKLARMLVGLIAEELGVDAYFDVEHPALEPGELYVWPTQRYLTLYRYRQKDPSMRLGNEPNRFKDRWVCKLWPKVRPKVGVDIHVNADDFFEVNEIVRPQDTSLELDMVPGYKSRPRLRAVEPREAMDAARAIVRLVRADVMPQKHEWQRSDDNHGPRASGSQEGEDGV